MSQSLLIEWLSLKAKEKGPLVYPAGLFFVTDALCRCAGRARLLDLRFLVVDVLTYDRIVFLDVHFVGMQALVLRGHVEMAGAGGRQQFHFFTHGSDLLAFGAHAGDDGLDAVLLDGAQTVGGNSQADPATLTLQPEALGVQIRQEAATLLVVGVGDAIADSNALSRDFADAAHKVLGKSVC